MEICINSPDSEVTVTEFSKNPELEIKEVFTKDVDSSICERINMKKGCVYAIFTQKKNEYKKGEFFGTIKVKEVDVLNEDTILEQNK